VTTYKVKSQGVEHTVTVVDKATGGSLVTVDGREFDVKLSGGDADSAELSRPVAAAWRPISRLSTLGASAPPASTATPVGDGRIVAPISGTIISIHVEVGDSVSVDQVVMKLEAMKMENDITASVSGTVQEIAVSEGTDASTDQLLMTIG
jgi:biotin carboxyl carrier protein